MPEMAAIGQFERRLVELGCPAARARRKAHELADHHADLLQAALDDGLTEGDAEARASAQLGEPSSLAENLAWIMRQSSWWGRHPFLGFCVLPLIGFIPVWVMCGWLLIALAWLAGHLLGPAYLVTVDTAHALALDPAVFKSYSLPLNLLLNSAAGALMAVLFCSLARRSVSGLRWIATACALRSISGAFSRTEILPGSIVVALVSSPNWMGAAIPWLVAMAAFARHWQVVRRFPARASGAVAAPRPPGGPLWLRQSPGQTWTDKILTTPTYWIAAPTVVALAVLGILATRSILHGRTALLEVPPRVEALRATTWPAESEAVMERLKPLPAPSASENTTTIDLRPWVNIPVRDLPLPFSDPAEMALPELPPGLHDFAGAPFDVSGRIQLMGRCLLGQNRLYPVIRKGLPIQQKCRRLYLLHGAIGAVELETKIARLVLHYADGSTRDLPIVVGEDVLDSWGPIYTTPATDEPLAPKSPETQLAWAGRPPASLAQSPWMAARVYRSTITNPQPAREISTVDYVSTLNSAAPFLVGLTVEK